jgi:predicted nucleic acid-binding protein
LARPLLVCEPVLTEAAYLLTRQFGTADDLFELLERGLLELAFELHDHRTAVRALMRRYRTTPMSLADACIVRMAELHANRVVWTLDSDFAIYRKNGRQVIPTLRPRR